MKRTLKYKPCWWPDNPYPESIFPMPREKYEEVVPDPKTRTALSGMLGREFWDIASESIWAALRDKIRELEQHEDELKRVIDELK